MTFQITDLDSFSTLAGSQLILCFMLFYIARSIIKKRVWKAESLLCMILWGFIFVDALWRLIWSATNIMSKKPILLLTDLPLFIIICGIILAMLISLAYYQWNVMDEFRNGISLEKRMLCKRIISFCVVGIILAHCIIYIDYFGGL